jgi:amino acid permease
MTEASPLLSQQHHVVFSSYDENQMQQDLLPVTSQHHHESNTRLHDAPIGTTDGIVAASYGGTITNIMKTCLGTGCLALPYACQQGGIILYVIGLIFIAIWNYIVMFLLIDCLRYIPFIASSTQRNTKQPPLQNRNETIQNENEEYNHMKNIDDVSNSKNVDVTISTDLLQLPSSSPPPCGISTMGLVAWYSFGTFGLQILDCIIVILFLGIITAYVAAGITFLHDTPFTTNHRWYDAILIGFIMGTLAIVPDIGYLSRASGIGLIVLFTTFFVIAGYAFISPTITEESSSLYSTSTTTNMMQITSTQNDTAIRLWPTSINSISHYYGIAVFGYGAVPLTYNFQESMQEPHRIVSATANAMALVAFSNVAVGVGLYLLFPNLTADILHELPSTGFLPSMTRLAMVGTIIATAPLLIVPCSELLEGRWVNVVHSPVMRRATMRYGLVSICVMVAVSLPDFVEVLALVGCFCVALVSFCVPPALHLRLLYLSHLNQNKQICGTMSSIDSESFPSKHAMLDIILLVWGVAATVVSTMCTLMR